MSAALLPCASCPWRIDQRASNIPNYQHGLACGLTSTTGKEDGFRNIMACHASTQENPFVCRGYLAREGDRNLNVRMLAARGKMPWPSQVADACRKAGIRLHRTYTAVLRKLAATQEAQ